MHSLSRRGRCHLTVRVYLNSNCFVVMSYIPPKLVKAIICKTMASNKKSNKCWRAKDVTPIFGGSQNNDKAKYSRRLLDTISINGDIAAALHEFADKYADRLPMCAVKDLRDIADASFCIHNHAF